MGFARDGRRILTVGTRSVRTWMLATGELASETARGPRGGGLAGSALAPQVDRWVTIAMAGDAHEFRIWNVATGDYLGEVPFPAGTSRFYAMDPSATRVLVGPDDGRFITLFSLDEGRVLATLDTGEVPAGAERSYFTMAFLGDGRIVGSTISGGIQRWEADGSGGTPIVEPLFREDGLEPNRLNELVGAPSGPFFAAVYSDGTRVYDANGTKRQEALEFYTPLAFSAGGERLVTRDHARLVVFDSKGAEVQSWALEAQQPGRLAISADGRWIAFGMDDGSFSAREIGAAPAAAAAPRRADVLPGAPSSLSATADGRALLIGCSDGSILSWALDAKSPAPLPSHGYDSYVSARVRDDGRMVTVGNNVLRCLAPDGTLEMECSIGNNVPAWSPDARLVAYFAREQALVVDTATGIGRIVATPMATDDPASSFDTGAVSNGGRIAAYCAERIEIFDAAGKLLRTVLRPMEPEPPPGMRPSIAFITEDRVAFGDTVRGGGVFDIATGETFGFAGPLTVAATDPARGRVAFRRLGEDETMALWHAAAPNVLVNIETPDAPSLATFLSTGQLVTTSGDRRIVVWEIDA